MTERRPRWGWIFGLAAGLTLGGWLAVDRWVEATVLPDLAPATSRTVLDRDGRLLMAYQVADGRWRLPVSVAEVDPGYLAQLIAFEDGRFHAHPGVDPLALLRAGGAGAAAGRDRLGRLDADDAGGAAARGRADRRLSPRSCARSGWRWRWSGGSTRTRSSTST